MLGFKLKDKHVLIDYIFLHNPNNACAVKQYGVLTDVWDNTYTPSDHRPIVCDLSIKVDSNP
jgi:hypothetical protein